MSITQAAKEFHEEYQNLKAIDIINGAQPIIPEILVGKNEPRKDIIGRPVKHGDLVAYGVNGISVSLAIVVGFTPEGFRLISFGRYGNKTLSYSCIRQPKVVLVHSS